MSGRRRIDVFLVLLEGLSHFKSFQVIIFSAELGLCSSSSTLHQSHPLVSKWLSTCQRSPCPKLSHHSTPPLPWDKSIYLFLHLWQTFHLLPLHLSICPYTHCSVSMCQSVICLVAPAAYMCHPPCPIRVTVLSHNHTALCSRALSGRDMYDIYALFIHTNIKGSAIWQSERCDSLTNLWLFFWPKHGG